MSSKKFQECKKKEEKKRSLCKTRKLSYSVGWFTHMVTNKSKKNTYNTTVMTHSDTFLCDLVLSFSEVTSPNI